MTFRKKSIQQVGDKERSLFGTRSNALLLKIWPLVLKICKILKKKSGTVYSLETTQMWQRCKRLQKKRLTKKDPHQWIHIKAIPK